ncbi:MAG: hypothetical protein AB8B53_15365 [Flavobacteriales bacterium]
MKMYKQFLVLILIITVSSCSTDRLKVDVSHVDLELTHKRLDQSFLPIQKESLTPQAEFIQTEIGGFSAVFFSYILQARNLSDSTLLRLSEEDIYPLVMEVQQGINAMESEINDQVQLLETGFKHLKYHFPETSIPEVVLMNSWFQYGVFTTDSTLAVGLDFFIEDSALQRLYPPQFYAYMKTDMTPDYIATNAMYGWLYNKVFPTEGEENTLIDHMVYKGKVRYLLEAMFPDVEEATIMNYTQKELDWCYKKQLAVWRELTKLREDNTPAIYETKKTEISKWVAQGPFTAALSEEATDRMGEWIGLQMIRDYMRENPEVSVNDMLTKNSRQISKYYNPKN